MPSSMPKQQLAQLEAQRYAQLEAQRQLQREQQVHTAARRGLPPREDQQRREPASTAQQRDAGNQ